MNQAKPQMMIPVRMPAMTNGKDAIPEWRGASCRR
jgi:hypothetical protein